MDMILQFLALYAILNVLAFFYIHQRLSAQDRYLSTYLRSFAEYNNNELPPFLNTTEIKEEIETKKPEVYSPRHDHETVMQGKVIDPFD